MTTYRNINKNISNSNYVITYVATSKKSTINNNIHSFRIGDNFHINPSNGRINKNIFRNSGNFNNHSNYSLI